MLLEYGRSLYGLFAFTGRIWDSRATTIFATKTLEPLPHHNWWISLGLDVHFDTVCHTGLDASETPLKSILLKRKLHHFNYVAKNKA